jgi:hypothetical protein
MIKSFFFYALIASVLVLITYVSMRSSAHETRLKTAKVLRRLPDDTQ